MAVAGNTKDAIIDFAAGSAGGVACVYAGQPLDTVKVKMQSFPTMYTNMTGCFLQTLRKEGIYRGLYAGTIPAVVANVAENSVLFVAYGFCQKAVAGALHTEVSKLSPLSNAVSGFLAAFFSSFTLCPTELVKCRLQALRELEMNNNPDAGKRNIGPWSLSKQILREEGIPGFFRGLTATITREMPGYFFFFGGYELCRHYLTPAGKTKDDIGLVRTVVSGGVGGMCLWVAVFPADVVKSRLQVSGSTESMTSLMLRIFRNEGVLALYNGLGPTLVRTFFASGALFVAYEWTKRGLHQLLVQY